MFTYSPLMIARAAGAAAGPQWLILAHCDGAAGSTVITNSAAGGQALAAGASCMLTTANKKFGTAGLDCADSENGLGYMVGSSSVLLDGMFSFMAQFKEASNQGVLLNIGNVDSTDGGIRFAHYLGTLYLTIRAGGTTTDIDQGAYSWAGGPFQQLGMERDEDGLITCSVNGAAVLQATNTGIFTGTPSVGAHDDGSFIAAGYWDEIALYKGGNLFGTYPFTPPAAPFAP